ncbi:MAG: hypothetical protein QME81_09585 [bacterium]|nr:hypothetical protein [bacterium]
MMSTIKEVKQEIVEDPKNWIIHFMDFVDDFRYYKDLSFVSKPFDFDNERIDALLTATIEYLCDELGLEPPEWVEEAPSCKYPWFVSGMENLKAIAIVESPLRFRMRKIFTLGNFLSRT